MTDEKFDRRVVRTKQQIRRALIELLAEKGESSIAVRELAQRANINRGTFYIHYKDIHDLVSQLMEEAIEKLVAVCKRHPPAQTPRASYPFLTDLFQTLQSDAPLFILLLGSSGSNAYSNRLCVAIQENFLDGLLSVFYSVDPKQRQVASEFIVAGCLHVALHWLKNGTKESPDEMAYLAGRVIMHGIDAPQN